jgi:hypothetical protein
MTSFAPPALDYNAACEKGRLLLQKMLASHDELTQLLKDMDIPAESEYLNEKVLSEHGWVEFPAYEKDENLKPLLVNLGMNTAFPFSISHSSPGLASPQGGPNRYAHFDTVVNPTAGVMAAVNTRSPMDNFRSARQDVEDGKTGEGATREAGDDAQDTPEDTSPLTVSSRTKATEDDIPALNYWSDVAYLHWTICATNSSNLGCVIRMSITNEKTKAVIQHIMQHATFMERFPEFPGITWTTEHGDQVAALLGTPNGAGVAWLLIQHKRQLGHKTVEKVTLVYNDKSETDNTKIPSLVFWFRDVVAPEPGMKRIG